MASELASAPINARYSPKLVISAAMMAEMATNANRFNTYISRFFGYAFR